jgi:hypothetical protein
MPKTLFIAVAAAWLACPGVAIAQSPAPAPATKTPTAITMTGCVSAKPDASGNYTFADAGGVSTYRLKGRKLSRFAGQRVEVVGGSADGGGLAVRGGLVGPIGGARGVALDPAQESIKRQPGGGGAGIGPAYPEFRVSKMKSVAGACEEAPPR